MHLKAQYLLPLHMAASIIRGTHYGRIMESQRGSGGRGVWAGMSIKVTSRSPQETPCRL